MGKKSCGKRKWLISAILREFSHLRRTNQRGSLPLCGRRGKKCFAHLERSRRRPVETSVHKKTGTPKRAQFSRRKQFSKATTVQQDKVKFVSIFNVRNPRP